MSGEEKGRVVDITMDSRDLVARSTLITDMLNALRVSGVNGPESTVEHIARSAVAMRMVVLLAVHKLGMDPNVIPEFDRVAADAVSHILEEEPGA